MDIEAIIFMIAWSIGLISWFLSIAELIATSRFSEWPFTKGSRVLKYKSNISIPNKTLEKELDFNNSKAKFISGNKILFCQKMKIFGFKLHTPFPIKGLIFNDNGQTYVEGRIPLFVQVFFVAWLVGWTVGGISNLIKTNGDSGLSFLLIGWLFAAGMVAISIPIEILRAKKTVSEIELFINKSA